MPGQNAEGEKNTSLLQRLSDYGKTDAYPFHMPGHKRQIEMGITSFPNPFSVDITEIEGFDNLHHAEGILRESMDHAAAVYGADRTYYLVNGSTAGILSAVCGLTEPGSRMIMARNSHKAAYHAAVLNRLDLIYLYPEEVGEYHIQGGIEPRDVEQQLEENRRMGGKPIRAVFITSPTYEGIVSDVSRIGEIAHRFGVPLIVDEAHGAHFPFGGGFPETALQCGADIVIQSLHKMLPSLTQTALLHVKSRLVKAEEVERYLSLFQSSSPSYLFLASIENCISYMEREGRRRMERYGKELQRWMRRAEGLSRMKLLTDSVCGRYGVKDRDCSKIVVFPGGCGLSGTELADRLRVRYHLEPEMACCGYVILMTSLMDTRDGMDRLWDALREIDREGDLNPSENSNRSNDSGQAKTLGGRVCADAPTWLRNPEKSRELAEAWNSPGTEKKLEEVAGNVCKGFVTVYPPGIPMLVPGEMITEEAIRLIAVSRKQGLTVEGLTEKGGILVCADLAPAHGLS